MKKANKKRVGFRKIARAHAIFFLISFGLYTALSAIFMPSFILSDMRTKSNALADGTITLVAKVLDSPAEPIVSGTAICTTGNLSVSLNWPTDENSTTFDIDRNGLPLITGLIDSQYTDINVTINTSYIYTVTAHGPMGPGFATSQPVTITTPEKCELPAPAPIIQILSFQKNTITNPTDIPQTTSLKPVFSGTTNIPFAKIFISLHSGPEITAIIYANGNGYWSWECPEALDLGEHLLQAMAVDPNNPAITASTVFSFEIITEKTSSTNSKNHTPKKTTVKPATTPTEITTITPFSIAVVVKNLDHLVYAGNNLSVHTDFIKKSASLASKDYELFYDIVDSDGRLFYETSEKINPAQINSIEKNIPIPILTKAGMYKIIVKTYDGRNLIEGEDFFQVKELPLISIGATTISLTQIMQGLGWISLLFLLLFFILLGIEYHQSEQALIQITENYLRSHGFLTKRKGVNR
jgi:hypothetical protein